MDEFIGYLAAFLTTASFLPQVIKTLKTRDTKGISAVMYSCFVCGIFLWIVYGIMIQNIIIILPNILTIAFASAILFVKLCNLRQGRD